MFRVENIESPRSGRPVANQFEVIMDTTVGRVILFQSFGQKEQEYPLTKKIYPIQAFTHRGTA